MRQILHAISALGLLFIAGLAMAGGTWFVNSGWLNHVTPKVPLPPQIETLKITLKGPEPRLVISGVSTVFTTEIDGVHGPLQWDIFPEGMGTIVGFGDYAELRANNEGDLTVVVIAPGDGRQVARARMQVTSIPQFAAPPPVIAQPVDNTPQPMPMPQQQQETVSQRIVVQLAMVNSTNRGMEAKIVAGAVNRIIGNIQRGLYMPSADPVPLIANEAFKGLGNSGPNWQQFLGTQGAIANVLDTFRAQGEITTIGDTVAALSEISSVLLQSQ